MEIQGLVLIAISALFWSFFDVFRKKVPSDYSVFKALFWMSLFQCPVFMLAAVYFKADFFPEKYLIVGLSGLLINFTANALFIDAVRRGSFSETVPLLCLSPVFSALLSFFLLAESLSLGQLSGIFLVIVGSFVLLSRLKLSNLRASLIMIIVALLWGGMSVFDKMGSHSSSIAVHLFYQCLGISFLSLIPISFDRRNKSKTREFKMPWKILLICSLASVGAMTFQLLSFNFSQVALAESAKRAFGLMITFLFSFLFFKETMNLRKYAAAVLMVLGIFLILK